MQARSCFQLLPLIHRRKAAVPRQFAVGELCSSKGKALCLISVFRGVIFGLWLLYNTVTTEKEAVSMYKFKYFGHHVEVCDVYGNFLFSADNIDEAYEMIEEMKEIA